MAQARDLEYTVEAAERGWSIRFSGECFGCWPSRRDALKAALDDARRVGHLGHRTRVLVRRADGSARLVWSSGQF